MNKYNTYLKINTKWRTRVHHKNSRLKIVFYYGDNKIIFKDRHGSVRIYFSLEVDYNAPEAICNKLHF